MIPKHVCVNLEGYAWSLGTGWLPPMPDLRDYTTETPEIAEMAKKLKLKQGVKSLKSAVPDKADLREWCSPVENQGAIGSCTAHAASGVIEYFQRRAYEEHLEASRLFIYKTTRNLMGVTGDTGGWLRNTMGALVLCGVPLEKYWEYTDVDPDFDEEPSSFVYAVADNFEALKYFCHDPLGANVEKTAVLESVKSFIAAGVPSMFGFFGFPSFSETAEDGGIPFPCENEQAEWGHAIVAVGYDDKKELGNPRCGRKTKGALLIRNSWGKEWGENGYGWLPYEYVLQGLAQDFWSILSMGWVDTKQFGL
ncbi:cysteine protease [Prosthecochloris sp. GSB1]|uniref:C1 family peptidase n=1 Tax=Prosthecochloris sp. GSB1 TaxID=281093 RepID=UPI000B8C7FC4|nr:C1 family peptidase [Prosthecochloris sp. GSB1]ASQ89625.1 cysteine protease [Prosthecochloris sp. GSB1]